MPATGVLTSAAQSVLPVSLVVGRPLVDRHGDRLGRVDDLIVRLDRPGYPPVSGLRVTIAGRALFVPIERVASLGTDVVRLAVEALDLGRFERRPGEVLLRRDVMDRQLINVDGARLVRANDIDVARVEGAWRVVGVETTARAALRRLAPRPIGRRFAPAELVDWASVEPFVGHVPSVRLRVPHPKLARLHPAQIADLVEAASHAEGEEIMRAVAPDRDREADVFEELDPGHKLEFIRERPDADAAKVLAAMKPDDAADLLAELDDDRRDEVLELLPPAHRRKLRALLGYDPATAGGLMTPDFLCLYQTATVRETLDRVARSDSPPESVTVVYAMNTHHELTGAVTLAELVRADPDSTLHDVGDRYPMSLHPDADLEEVARTMADFNLLTVPVVDEQQRMIGAVTVDDALEALLPPGWRRRFGLLGD